MRRLPVFVLLSGLLACSSPWEPRGAAGPIELEFDATRVTGFIADPPVTIEGGKGRVAVEGRLSTPCGGWAVTAELTEDEALVLRVIADGRNPDLACRAIVESFEYGAVLRNLSPGEYRVRVLHVYRRWSEDPDAEVRRTETATVRVD